LAALAGILDFNLGQAKVDQVLNEFLEVHEIDNIGLPLLVSIGKPILFIGKVISWKKADQHLG
jgi:hypothetical protein